MRSKLYTAWSVALAWTVSLSSFLALAYHSIAHVLGLPCW